MRVLALFRRIATFGLAGHSGMLPYQCLFDLYVTGFSGREVYRVPFILGVCKSGPTEPNLVLTVQ